MILRRPVCKAAIAIDNATLLSNLQSSNLQLALAYDATIEGWSRALDLRDRETEGHSLRVTEMGVRLARAMGMSEEEVERVHLSGIIHDVGKIGIEDKILRKPAALTDDEYEIMKQHPRKGEHILAAVPLLKDMAGAGLMHHENWDGSGYPDGLKGEQIPLFARIVAVADTFDAITTNRPYQQAYSLKFAVETITRLTGGRFDAKVVTAFLRAFEAGEIRAGAQRPSRTEATLVEAQTAAGQS